MTNILADAMRAGAITEARSIDEITSDILRNKDRAGLAILEIGRGLIEAKALLAHGEWTTWLTESVEFSERSAQNFMRLARDWSNPQTLAVLGAAKALTLLALTPADREEFVAEAHVVDGEVKTVTDMSTRELAEAIRERKEAMEAKEVAEADKRLAEQSRDKLSQEMVIANATMESLRETEAHLDGVIANLRKELAELKAQPIESTYSEVPETSALDAARQEGAVEAAKAAKKEAEEKLKAKIEKAEKAKADAEAQVKTARAEQEATRAKAEALEKQLKLVSNPAATEYKVYFANAQKDLAGLKDCLDRLATSDPELCAKMTAALAALGKQICDDAAARLEGGAQS